MPLYEYKCTKCGRTTEKIESVSGPHLRKCPHCGGKVESLISAPAIQFKGSGWYVTDYAAKAASGDGAGADKTAGETKDSPAKESSKETAAEKPAGDSPKETSSKESKGSHKEEKKSVKKK